MGKHFSLLVYDDVVTPDSVTTPDMIKKTTENWQLSLNIGASGGRRRMIGTRYHYNDTYATVIKQGSAIPRIYPATNDGTFEGTPVFLAREQLNDKRRDMGPYVFSCQMLQDPAADSTMGFRAEWFRTHHNESLPLDKMNRYILVDPAGEKKKGSDYTTMWVIGLSEDGNVYVLDGVHDRLNLGERTKRLFILHRKYRPNLTGYEKYGMQADVEHIEEVMQREAYTFPVVQLGGNMPKFDRIRRLVPKFEQGRIIFPYRLLYADIEGRTHDLTQEFLEDEYLAFPVCAHDDMLDCLARYLDPEFPVTFPRPKEFVAAGGSAPRRARQASQLY